MSYTNSLNITSRPQRERKAKVYDGFQTESSSKGKQKPFVTSTPLPKQRISGEKSFTTSTPMSLSKATASIIENDVGPVSSQLDGTMFDFSKESFESKGKQRKNSVKAVNKVGALKDGEPHTDSIQASSTSSRAKVEERSSSSKGIIDTNNLGNIFPIQVDKKGVKPKRISLGRSAATYVHTLQPSVLQKMSEATSAGAIPSQQNISRSSSPFELTSITALDNTGRCFTSAASLNISEDFQSSDTQAPISKTRGKSPRINKNNSSAHVISSVAPSPISRYDVDCQKQENLSSQKADVSNSSARLDRQQRQLKKSSNSSKMVSGVVLMGNHDSEAQKGKCQPLPEPLHEPGLEKCGGKSKTIGDGVKGDTTSAKRRGRPSKAIIENVHMNNSVAGIEGVGEEKPQMLRSSRGKRNVSVTNIARNLKEDFIDDGNNDGDNLNSLQSESVRLEDGDRKKGEIADNKGSQIDGKVRRSTGRGRPSKLASKDNEYVDVCDTHSERASGTPQSDVKRMGRPLKSNLKEMTVGINEGVNGVGSAETNVKKRGRPAKCSVGSANELRDYSVNEKSSVEETHQDQQTLPRKRGRPSKNSGDWDHVDSVLDKESKNMPSKTSIDSAAREQENSDREARAAKDKIIADEVEMNVDDNVTDVSQNSTRKKGRPRKQTRDNANNNSELDVDGGCEVLTPVRKRGSSYKSEQASVGDGQQSEIGEETPHSARRRGRPRRELEQENDEICQQSEIDKCDDFEAPKSSRKRGRPRKESEQANDDVNNESEEAVKNECGVSKPVKLKERPSKLINQEMKDCVDVVSENVDTDVCEIPKSVKGRVRSSKSASGWINDNVEDISKNNIYVEVEGSKSSKKRGRLSKQGTGQLDDNEEDKIGKDDEIEKPKSAKEVRSSTQETGPVYEDAVTYAENESNISEKQNSTKQRGRRSQSTSDTPEQAVSAQKRGRPRKAEAESINNSSENGNMDNNETQTYIKKRERSSKSGTEQMDSCVDNVSEKEVDAELEQKSTKKRGRPDKSGPGQIDHHEESDTEQDDTIEQPKFAKKRGRPSKSGTGQIDTNEEKQDNTTEEPKSVKKRGRPSKSDTGQIDYHEDSDTEQDDTTEQPKFIKKRGRQSKSDTGQIDHHEDSDTEQDDTTEQPKFAKKTGKTSKSDTGQIDYHEESDTEQDDTTEQPKSAKKKGRPSKEEFLSKRKPTPVKFEETLATSRKSRRSTQRIKAESSDEEEEEEKMDKEPPPKKAKVDRSRRSTKRIKAESSDEEEEEKMDNEPPPKKAKVNKVATSISCGVCQESFDALFKIKRHMMTVHSLVYSKHHPEGVDNIHLVVKQLGYADCPKCHKRFRFAQYYKHHREWCGRESELVTCSICNKMVKAMWFYQHERSHKLTEKKRIKAEEEEEEKKRIKKEKAERGDEDDHGKGRMKRKAANSALKNINIATGVSTASDGDGGGAELSSNNSYKESGNESEQDDDEEDEEDEVKEEEERIEEDDDEDVDDDRKPTTIINKRYYYKYLKWRNLFSHGCAKPNTFKKLTEFYDSFPTDLLFPHLKPVKSQWNQLGQSSRSQYLLGHNPTINFRAHTNDEGKNGERSAEQQSQYSLMCGQTITIKDKTYAFTGGPIHAIEWCPLPKDAGCDQVMAVALDFVDGLLNCNETVSDSAIVQLWRMKTDVAKFEKKTSPPQVSLHCCLAYDEGRVRGMSWCPRRAYQASINPSDCDTLARLGLLAVACSSGVVLVYSIPHLTDTGEQVSRDASSPSTENIAPVPIVKPEPSLRLSINGPAGKLGPCLCVAWQDGVDSRFIAGGYANGTIVLWDVSNCCSLLKREGDNTRLPTKCLVIHSAPVMSLAWCQHLPNYLASVSQDYNFCLSDTARPGALMPMDLRKLHPVMSHRLLWAGPLYMGYFTAEESLEPSDGCGVRYIGLAHSLMSKKRFMTLNMHDNLATTWDIDFCPFSEVLVCCDANGKVKILLTDLERTVKQKIRNHPTNAFLTQTALLYQVDASPQTQAQQISNTSTSGQTHTVSDKVNTSSAIQAQHVLNPSTSAHTVSEQCSTSNTDISEKTNIGEECQNDPQLTKGNSKEKFMQSVHLSNVNVEFCKINSGALSNSHQVNTDTDIVACNTSTDVDHSKDPLDLNAGSSTCDEAIDGPSSCGDQVIAGLISCVDPFIAGPSTCGDQTIDEPSTYGDQTIDEPSTYGDQTIDEPSTYGDQTIDEPSTCGDQTIDEPSTCGDQTIDEPNTCGDQTIDEPSTYGDQTIDEPSTCGDQTIDGPSTYGDQSRSDLGEQEREAVQQVSAVKSELSDICTEDESGSDTGKKKMYSFTDSEKLTFVEGKTLLTDKTLSHPENLANLDNRVISKADGTLIRYPFNPDRDVSEPDWEVYLRETATMIAQQQSPKRLLEVRGRLYELLTHCIPADVIMKGLLRELLQVCDGQMKAEVVQNAAYYEQRLQQGQKAIYHLEAFVAKFMAIYKRFLEEGIADIF